MSKYFYPGEWNSPGDRDGSIVASTGIRLSNHIKGDRISFQFVFSDTTKAKLPDQKSLIVSSLKTDTGIPKLMLDVNPQSFSVTMNKAKADSSYTRAGFVPQFWGDEIDIIQVEGTTSAFISQNEGLTRQNAQKDTAGYKTFVNLLSYYKNNGAEFLDPTTLIRPPSTGKTLGSIRSNYQSANKGPTDQNSSSRKIIKLRQLINMKYLTLSCFGLFESLSFSENAEKPFHFNYSFAFAVLFYNTDNAVQIDGHLKRKNSK